MADDWEEAYFGGPTNAVASADPDGDDMTNGEEYIAGTVPTNGASVFLAALAALPEGSVVSWDPVVSGRVYAVDRTLDLDMSFSNLQDGIPYPQGDYTDTNSAPDAYYRVGVRLP
jgi:hypothetical protein